MPCNFPPASTMVVMPRPFAVISTSPANTVVSAAPLGTRTQAAAKASAGVRAGEILFRKAAELQERHGERVAHRQGGRRARGGREIERAGFGGEPAGRGAGGGA